MALTSFDASCVTAPVEDKLPDTTASTTSEISAPTSLASASTPLLPISHYRELLWSTDHPQGLEYAEDLGISRPICNLYKVGYDPDTDALMIPCGDSTVYRVTRNDRDKMLFTGEYIGEPALFVPGSANGAKSLILTSDPVSALSLISKGHMATAMAPGQTPFDDFARRIHSREIRVPLLLWLDNTPEGKADAEKLSRHLKAEEYRFRVIDQFQSYRSPCVTVKKCAPFVENELKKIFDDTASNGADVYFDMEFDHDVQIQAECVKFISGISSWDGKMRHFRPGPTIIAAAPGTGKSTLVIQLALNTASRKIPVFYFSTELSRIQIVAKMLSNTAFLMNSGTQVSSMDIMDGYNCKEVDDAKYYWRTQLAPFLMIHDDVHTAEQISDIVKQYIKKSGERPLVIIDYLQKLTDGDGKAKEPSEANAMVSNAIRALCIEATVPVICVSSTARSAYCSTGDVGAAKWSGEIDYDADTVLQIIPTAILENEENPKSKKTPDKVMKEEMGKAERRMTLKASKNRFLEGQYEANVVFYAAHDTYLAEYETPASRIASTPGTMPLPSVFSNTSKFEEVKDDEDLPF